MATTCRLVDEREAENWSSGRYGKRVFRNLWSAANGACVPLWEHNFFHM